MMRHGLGLSIIAFAGLTPWAHAYAESTCRLEVHGGAVELTAAGDATDDAAWLTRCRTLVQFLHLPALPWSQHMADQSAAALGRLDDFSHTSCTAPSEHTIACTLTRQYRVLRAEIRGSLPFAFTRSDLLHRLSLHAGALVADLDEAVHHQQERLQTYLRSEGYDDAQVQVHIAWSDGDSSNSNNSNNVKLGANRGVDVLVDIQIGAATEVGHITISGDHPVDDATIAAAYVHPIVFKWGRLRYRRAQVDDDSETVRKLLQERGWPAANVRAEPHRNGETARMDIDVHVEAGPALTVRFVGNAALSTDDLTKVLTFRSNNSADTLEVENTRLAIVEAYQRKGYPDVHVQTSIDKTNRGFTATYEIREGAQRWVQHVSYVGNKTFKPTTLADGAPVYTAATTLGIIHHPWVDRTIRHDVQALQAFYQGQGFPSAKVDVARLNCDAPEPEGIAVQFIIDEGPRHTVAAIHWEGLPAGLDPNDWHLTLKPNGAYTQAALQADADTIRGTLATHGYFHAQVKPRLAEPSALNPNTAAQVKVTYGIDPGVLARRDGLLMTGNLQTRDSTIAEEFTLEDGDPIDLVALGATQKRLRALRIFDSVQIQPITVRPDNANTTLVVPVQEADTAALDAVISFSTDDAFAIGADFRHRNLLGRALTLDSTLRIGNAEQVISPRLRIGNVDKLQAKLQAPRPFGLPLDAQITAIYLYEDHSLYRYRDIGGTGTLSRNVLTRDTCDDCPTLTLKLGYELVAARYDQKVATPTGMLPRGAPTYVPSSTIARLIPEIWVDGRDSALDPRSGYAGDIRFDIAHPTLAGPFIGGATAFWRLLATAQGYITVATPRWVRLSDGHWLGGPLVAAVSAQYFAAGPWTARGAVPSSETFAYGGDFSVRGLVDRASSVAMLAHSMAVLSAEMRWYLWDMWIGTWQLAGFADLGTIASTPNHLFEDTTVSVGPMVRYVTPVGPLSLGYGIAVVRPAALLAYPHVMPRGGRVHFSFGYSF